MSETRTTASNGAAPPRLRLPLASAGDVARELARLYRQARAGQMEVQDASRLANILQILARVLETSDLEARIEELEAIKGEGKGSAWATH
ncbi:hypothetical protein [Alicycliphilus denitrificans]|uniref:Uncharacterized protein n=1 Tax=Alicycliphilus denitrificans (strain DSM 14773 / CIP 107495 / K601) TaxID=596154 RepID=F4G7I5_ALIDK|nr:hypothetical protein [Alicycliphilus denitrificans]AEB85515.1 hypothetical protein Alide2_3174 [Alicycliphilus denitrificans K601]